MLIQYGGQSHLALIKGSDFNQWSVEYFGEFNSYPQQIAYSVSNSPAAATAHKIATRFIKGNILPEWHHVKINRYGQTLADLVEFCAASVALNYGYCMHVGYNEGTGIISEIAPIPFTFARIKQLREDSPVPDELAIWRNWCNENPRQKMARRPYFFPRFDIDKAGQQFTDMGEKWAGQVQYAVMNTGSNSIYPFSAVHACRFDADSDGRFSKVRNGIVANGLWQSGMITAENGLSEQTIEDFQRELGRVMGDNAAGGVLMMPNMGGLKFEAMTRQDDDKLFQQTGEVIRNNIRQVFGIPSPIFGENVAGKLGNAQEVEEAFYLYNSTITELQQFVQRKLNEVLAFSEFGEIELQPLQWSQYYAKSAT
jgi:hypothetical protein